MPGHGICRWAPAPAPVSLVITPTTAPATPSHLEIPMTRPTGHAASRPFRLTRAAVDAHREHYPTPFLGCPICVRRTAMTPIRIRWNSPRQA